MVTKMYKIYGAEGHRQRESFNNSQRYDFSKNGKTRILEIFNQDKTWTNDYSILKITCDTLSEVESELDGQLSDGIFENFRVGRIDEVQ